MAFGAHDDEISALLDQNNLLTFRYLAQRVDVSANEAKEALKGYAKRYDSVRAVYLVGGVPKNEANGSSMRYTLVQDDKLDATKAAFEPLTACHLYSLHSGGATSGEALYILNHGQDRELYDGVSRPPALCVARAYCAS